ncbi:hypothetical protein POTOM_034097 [Populus tomentosa]|uniref:Tim10-like domain-containing protein n=1 Tax=Populus tomentosa TaxID=118781 RepID=A0A8X8CP37_POPTO|nr:hypothetical protein POTOM_034097 [Populus tomentosa]
MKLTVASLAFPPKTLICIHLAAPSTLLLQYGISTMAANNVGLPAGVSKEQAYGMAETEMEYRVELFNRLLNTCFNKCIDKRHKEAELNMGENSCVDRCVSKYWAVVLIVRCIISPSCYKCKLFCLDGCLIKAQMFLPGEWYYRPDA